MELSEDRHEIYVLFVFYLFINLYSVYNITKFNSQLCVILLLDNYLRLKAVWPYYFIVWDKTLQSGIVCAVLRSAFFLTKKGK